MIASPAASACSIKASAQPRSNRCARRGLLAYVEPQVGGDLLVAAAAGVQLQRKLADLLSELEFDKMMHVLRARICREGAAARAIPAVFQDRVEAVTHLRRTPPR